MPLSPDFTADQVYGAANQIVLTDTSTGSDGAIAARRVYITDKDGNPVVKQGTTTTYELWQYANATIDLPVLLKDMALNIRVDWVDSGSNVLYSKPILTYFRLYALTYYIFLLKSQSSNTKLIDHANFYINEIKLLCSLQEANTAIVIAADITSAQAALSRAKELIDHPSYFF